MSSDKKPPEKKELIFAAKEPKQKPGPTNGVIYINDTKVLESIGYHSMAGRSDGRMKTNQDSFFIDTSINGDPQRALMAVFDGHGLQGHRISSYLVHNLRDIFALKDSEAGPSEYTKSLTETCHILNNMLKKSVYVDTKLSGSTGIIVTVDKDKIVCANVGDSRAVLLRMTGNQLTVVPLSVDQKPSDPVEKQRIISHGGKVHPSRRRLS